MLTAIRAVLADDHPLIRTGPRARLLVEPAIAVVGNASSRNGVVSLCCERKPEVLVLDLSMPGPPATQFGEQTVRNYCSRLSSKLGAHTRTEATV